MHVLWIATKCPVPPVDGGRLVQKLTLEALAARGVRLTLLAPVFPGEDRLALYREAARFCDPLLVPVDDAASLVGVVRSAGRSLRPGALPAVLPGSGGSALPFALARHAHRRLRQRAQELAASKRFGVVHAEQLHALPQAEPFLERRVPVVLRAQNVESDLWSAAAGRLPSPARLAARREARRLARWEGEAVGRVARAVALTEPDAARLEELAAASARPHGAEGRRAGRSGLDRRSAREGAAGAGTSSPAGTRAFVQEVGGDGSGRAPVEVVNAPFPGELPTTTAPLPGAPAVVVLGSGGWLPNRDSREWMEVEVWPTVKQRLPGAMLHLFGGAAGEPPSGGDASVVRHPAPADSAAAFAPGSVLAVPLRIASGVRMKILEAWARGVAVVATPEAAAGLAARDGVELLVASGPEELTTAFARLAAEPDLRERLVAAGRSALAEHHAPEGVAERLESIYRSVRVSRAR